MNSRSFTVSSTYVSIKVFKYNLNYIESFYWNRKLFWLQYTSSAFLSCPPEYNSITCWRLKKSKSRPNSLASSRTRVGHFVAAAFFLEMLVGEVCKESVVLTAHVIILDKNWKRSHAKYKVKTEPVKGTHSDSYSTDIEIGYLKFIYRRLFRNISTSWQCNMFSFIYIKMLVNLKSLVLKYLLIWRKFSVNWIVNDLFSQVLLKYSTLVVMVNL